MPADLIFCWLHIPNCWKSHVTTCNCVCNITGLIILEYCAYCVETNGKTILCDMKMSFCVCELSCLTDQCLNTRYKPFISLHDYLTIDRMYKCICVSDSQWSSVP